MWSLHLSKNILENSSSKIDQSDRLLVSLIDHPLCQSEIEYVSMYLSHTLFYSTAASLWQTYFKHSKAGTASNMLIPLRNSSLMKQIQSAITQEPIKQNQLGCTGPSWTSHCSEILLGSNQQQNQSTTWTAGLDPAAILCICGSAEPALDMTEQRRAGSISTRRGSSNNHMLILKRSRSHWFSRAFLRTETHFPDSVNQTLRGGASAQDNLPQPREIEMPYWFIQHM